MSQSLIRATTAFVGLLALITAASNAFSQQRIASLAPPSYEARTGATAPAITPDSAAIVAGFVAAEARVREALNQHTFKRDVVLQTIGPNGEVTGEYIRNSQFVFDDRGRRIERVLFHPKSTIREMRITKEDIQDLSDGQLLGIDIAEAAKYQLTYAGIETLESLQLYAVDVTPRLQPDPNHMSERFFIGRVWLDPNTFQIVKLKGIIEPQGKQRFPVFETWRAPIRDTLAFPIRTEADDVLHFTTSDVHYRIKVRYYDYKQFGSKVSVTELDEPAPEVEPNREVNPPKLAPPKPGKLPNPPEVRPRVETSSTTTSIPVIKASPKALSCDVNRTAPPVGPYHWPADAEVKVYFLHNMFTAEQRDALLEAMTTWSTATETRSGVQFRYAGETDGRMGCIGCLTVGRKEIYKRDKHHYAFFHPMREERGVLVSAWIDLDFGITKPEALKGFMVHELAHGLGLWDCETCKKKQTIMNGFPGINKDNGLVMPSACDITTVQSIYQEERQIATNLSQPVRQSDSIRTVATLAVPSAASDDARVSVPKETRPSGAGVRTSPASDDRSLASYLFPNFSAFYQSSGLRKEKQQVGSVPTVTAPASQPAKSESKPSLFTLFAFDLERPTSTLQESHFHSAFFFGNYFRNSASIIR